MREVKVAPPKHDAGSDPQAVLSDQVRSNKEKTNDVLSSLGLRETRPSKPERANESRNQCSSFDAEGA